MAYPIVFSAPFIVLAALSAGRTCSFKIINYKIILLFLAANALVVVASSSKEINFLFALLTMSCIILSIVEVNAISPRSCDMWGKALILLCCLELLIGLIQLAARGFPVRLPYRDFSPDVFLGTLGSGGHRIVTAYFFLGIVWLVFRYSMIRIKILIAQLAFLLGFILPGANATIACGILAVIGYSFINLWTAKASANRRSKKISTLKVAAAAVVVTAGSAFFVVSGNAEYFLENSTAFVHEDGIRPNPRKIVFRDVILRMPEKIPYQPLIGVGLGNFSSWAQLMLSGVYVDRFVTGSHTEAAVPLPISYRPETWDLLLVHFSLPYLDEFSRWYLESVTTQPQFTWLTLYTEGGIIAISMMIALFASIYRKAVAVTIYHGQSAYALAKTIKVYTLFLILMYAVDNYLEYPWLMLPYMIGAYLLPGIRGANIIGYRAANRT